MEKEIEELRRYILSYNGDILEAMGTIGGLKRVRNVLGWGGNFAVLDPRLYVAPKAGA